MQKIILCASLSSLLLLNGCTSCQNNNKDNILKEKETEKEMKQEIDKKVTKGLQPFKYSFDTNITKEEEDIVKNLDEQEISVINDIQPRILEETQKIPDCLKNAESKEEAFECSKSLRELNKNLAMAMGDLSEELPEEKGYDKDFIWDEETKRNMIQEMESGLLSMRTMQACIESAKEPTDIDKCFDGVTPKN